jgi:hypothetical protein
MDKLLRDRISQVAILARNAGFPDVGKWMLAQDKREAKGTRKGKRVVFVGKEIRGKAQKFYIDADFLARSETPDE